MDSSSSKRSRNLIDGFLKFLHQIALELVSDNIDSIKVLVGDIIPNTELGEIQKGTQVVSCLKRYGLLSENNLDFFIELLEECRRVDLANRVREHQKTVKIVKNASQHQMDEKLPAPQKEFLYLLFSGKTSSITIGRIDHIKDSICLALEFKKSEVFYLAAQDISPSYTSVRFQLPATENKIQRLLMDALNKNTWVTDLEVVELTVDSKSSIKIGQEKKDSLKLLK